MATCAPFIGDMDSLVQAASQIYLPKALSESLGMTRADPPQMLTTPPTKHKASSHKGLFIYYVIQFGGLGRPPTHVIL